jgi:hypothetical protein
MATRMINLRIISMGISEIYLNDNKMGDIQNAKTKTPPPHLLNQINIPHAVICFNNSPLIKFNEEKFKR